MSTIKLKKQLATSAMAKALALSKNKSLTQYDFMTLVSLIETTMRGKSSVRNKEIILALNINENIVCGSLKSLASKGIIHQVSRGRYSLEKQESQEKIIALADLKAAEQLLAEAKAKLAKIA